MAVDQTTFPNTLGQVLTPSAVIIDNDGQVLVGMAARERQVTHAVPPVNAFKRDIGTNRVTRLGEREFLPEELSALVLARVKSDAEHHPCASEFASHHRSN